MSTSHVVPRTHARTHALTARWLTAECSCSRPVLAHTRSPRYRPLTAAAPAHRSPPLRSRNEVTRSSRQAAVMSLANRDHRC